MKKSALSGTLHSREYQVLVAMLRERREAAGIKQTDLAKALRTDQPTVSRFERGEVRLDLVQVRRWCEALQVPFADFANSWAGRTS